MSERSAIRNWVEFIPAFLLLKLLGLLPRAVAIGVSQTIARAIYHLHKKLRRTGHRNLEMALPQLTEAQHAAILKSVFENLGRLLGEFSQFPRITGANIDKRVVYDGFENYARAAARGKGVLMLTGHIGAWELCAFAQGMYGHALDFLARPLDNPLLDRLINDYRGMSGNRVIDKNRSVKGVLSALKHGRDVGLLIDVNTLPEEGVFCDFFGIPASSTSGLAVFALRSEAPVVPGFLLWDEKKRVHVLRFEPEVEVIRTGDFKEEVAVNTARFTRVIEECVRRHPHQWLWIHKRWRTRPAGEPDLYAEPAMQAASQASIKAKVEV